MEPRYALACGCLHLADELCQQPFPQVAQSTRCDVLNIQYFEGSSSLQFSAIPGGRVSPGWPVDPYSTHASLPADAIKRRKFPVQSDGLSASKLHSTMVKSSAITTNKSSNIRLLAQLVTHVQGPIWQGVPRLRSQKSLQRNFPGVYISCLVSLRAISQF